MINNSIQMVFTVNELREPFEDLLSLYDQFEEDKFAMKYPALNAFLDKLMESELFMPQLQKSFDAGDKLRLIKPQFNQKDSLLDAEE